MNLKLTTGTPELHPIPAKSPWYQIGIDFARSLSPESDGSRYILTISDYFTKWVEVIPTPDKSANSPFQGVYIQTYIIIYMPYYVHTVLVIIKLPFYARTYARTRTRATPVLVPVLRPYSYPCYARTRIRATPVPMSCYARTRIRATPVPVHVRVLYTLVSIAVPVRNSRC